MRSQDYVLGVVVGVVAALALGWFILSRKEKRDGKREYDERQQQIRGGCYRVAFWTLAAYTLLNGFLALLTGWEWADAITSSFVGFCLATTVFVVLCIGRDAYFPVNEKSRFYMIMFSVTAGVNALAFAANLVQGEAFVTDGRLNYHCMNAVMTVMFAAIVVAMALRARRERACEE